MEAAFPLFSRSDFEGEPSGRAYRSNKVFEVVIDRLFGDRVRADGAYGVDLWCALTNVEWCGPQGEKVSYPFRRAGEVVAWIREEGDYLTWYCSGEPGVVAQWIGSALNKAGWSWKPLDLENSESSNGADV